MSKKVMKLIDPNTGLMECRICGARHFANIRPDSNGHFYRGSWQCPNGCRWEKLEDYLMVRGEVREYTIKNAKGELVTITR